MFNSCCAIKGIFWNVCMSEFFFNAIVLRFLFVYFFFLILALKYTVPVQVPAENAGLRKFECFRACGHLFSLHWNVPLMCMGRLIPRSSAAVQNFTPYAPVKNVLKPHSGKQFFIYLFFLQRSALVSRSAINNTRKTWWLILSIQVGFMFRIHYGRAQCPKLFARLTPSQKAAAVHHMGQVCSVQWFIEKICLSTFFGGYSANMSHL